MAFWIIAAAVVAVALTILLMPKPKKPKPEAATDMEDPTAEAGRPIPVIFGTVIVKGLNVLDFMEKQVVTKKVDA